MRECSPRRTVNANLPQVCHLAKARTFRARFDAIGLAESCNTDETSDTMSRGLRLLGVETALTA